MKKIYSFIVLCCMAFSSCELEKEINYDSYYTEDKIVIHGFISQGEGVKAIIKKTLSPLNTQGSSYIHNPEVWLLEDGKPLEKMIEKDSSFFTSRSGLVLGPGKNYTILVKASGLPNATSLPQKMLTPLRIDTVFSTRIAYTSSDWYIAIWICDNIETTDYFGFRIWHYKDGEKTDFNEEFQMLPRISEDSKFPGPIIKIEHQMNMPHRAYLREEIDSFQVELFTVSKEYFDYDKGMDDFDFSYGSSFNEHIYPVKSNIIGGYGFFCSYEKTTYGSTGRDLIIDYSIPKPDEQD